MKKLSIIIPVYNVEQYIESCLQSVIENNLNETEYEIIVVDDESPDNSINKIQYLINDNIKVFSQKNKGLGGARNTGILNASGKYLLFLDSDDKIMTNSLSVITHLAIQNKVDVLEFGAQGIDGNGNIVYKIQNTSENKIYKGIDYYNKIRYMNSACNKLYSRNFLLENELFFLERIFIEDFEFNTRVFAKAKKVLAVNNIVGLFLQSENSITRNSNTEKRQKMINDIIFVLKETVKIQNRSKKDKCSLTFFEERKAFLVSTLFFQLVKDKATYNELKELKNRLIKEQLFFATYRIYDPKKNLFRIFLLKNLWVYKTFKLIFNFIK